MLIISSFNRPPHPIVYYESMLSKSHDIPVIIPLVETVTETIQLAKQWTAQAQHVQVHVLYVI